MNSRQRASRGRLAALALACALPQDPSWNLLPDRAPAVRNAAFAAAADTADPRWLSPLVDLLAFAETAEEWYAILDAAGAILDEDLRGVDRPWRTLTQRFSADAAATPAFRDPWGWKRELLMQRVDPRFAELLPKGVESRVPPVEVVWGGVGVEGIPALVNAPQIAADEADYLRPDEPVFGVYLNGAALAYPQRIVDWHEMAIDTIGGVPVALAYCTLCGAAVLYDRRAGERTLDFRTSGLLQRSNKLMFDVETRSLWNQLTGEPVIGPLASSGLRLDVLPVVTTTWARWRSDHPDTQVLALETGYERDYAPGAAYGEYFRSPNTMFPVPATGGAAGSGASGDFADKQRLVIVRVGAASGAFDLASLAGSRVHNVDVAGTGVVLLVGEASGPDQTWPGWGDAPQPAAVRAYARGELRFREAPGRAPASELVDDSGRRWTVDEERLTGPSAQALERLASHGAFGFAWHAFFPEGRQGR